MLARIARCWYMNFNTGRKILAIKEMSTIPNLPDITPCPLANIYRLFEVSLCLHLQGHGRLHILNVHGFTWFLLHWKLFLEIVVIYNCQKMFNPTGSALSSDIFDSLKSKYQKCTKTTENIGVNPLQTKRRPLYLKTQSVPRCKHFSSRL